ncbi:MAG: TetR/AcrR family transcriptional regulator [Xanthomonadales bacterium]|nr:TetR/AcrR family transcriptional regulator [Xanthomonadales bacterium]
MSNPSTSGRRAARRIGVDQGADFEQRRRIILREAARAFNEKGVENTSLDDIAARLNVTKPALYHYVSSKDEFVSLCLAQAMEDNQRLLEEAGQRGGTGLEQLIYIFERWVQGVVSDFGRSIVLVDLRTLSDASRREHRKAQRQLLRSVESIIQRGIEDGSVRRCSPAVMALSLIGLFNSPARWYREDGGLSIEEIAQELMALLTNGVAASPE